MFGAVSAFVATADASSPRMEWRSTSRLAPSPSGYETNREKVLRPTERRAVSEDRIIDKAIVVQGADGQYHVRAMSSNGEVILTSEKYENYEWAVKIAQDLGVPVEEP